jgi:hypothetical protein
MIASFFYISVIWIKHKKEEAQARLTSFPIAKQLPRIQQLPQAIATIALCELCAATVTTRALTEGTDVCTCWHLYRIPCKHYMTSN